MTTTHEIYVSSLRHFVLRQIPVAMPYYLAPNRHYHNWLHVEKCLALTERLNITPFEKSVLGLCFLYHDAIYIPGLESEEMSAEILKMKSNEFHAELSRNHGYFDKISKEYYDVLDFCEEIMLPFHKVKSFSNSKLEQLSKLFDDVDYAILGSNWTEYRTYVENVKKEYLYWCTEDQFLAGRKAFLEGLRNKQIFHTAQSSVMFETLEKQAHKNIEDELKIAFPILIENKE